MSSKKAGKGNQSTEDRGGKSSSRSGSPRRSPASLQLVPELVDLRVYNEKKLNPDFVHVGSLYIPKNIVQMVTSDDLVELSSGKGLKEQENIFSDSSRTDTTTEETIEIKRWEESECTLERVCSHKRYDNIEDGEEKESTYTLEKDPELRRYIQRIVRYSGFNPEDAVSTVRKASYDIKQKARTSVQKGNNEKQAEVWKSYVEYSQDESDGSSGEEVEGDETRGKQLVPIEWPVQGTTTTRPTLARHLITRVFDQALAFKINFSLPAEENNLLINLTKPSIIPKCQISVIKLKQNDVGNKSILTWIKCGQIKKLIPQITIQDYENSFLEHILKNLSLTLKNQNDFFDKVNCMLTHKYKCKYNMISNRTKEISRDTINNYLYNFPKEHKCGIGMPNKKCNWMFDNVLDFLKDNEQCSAKNLENFWKNTDIIYTDTIKNTFFGTICDSLKGIFSKKCTCGKDIKKNNNRSQKTNERTYNNYHPLRHSPHFIKKTQNKNFPNYIKKKKKVFFPNLKKNTQIKASYDTPTDKIFDPMKADSFLQEEEPFFTEEPTRKLVCCDEIEIGVDCGRGTYSATVSSQATEQENEETTAQKKPVIKLSTNSLLLRVTSTDPQVKDCCTMTSSNPFNNATHYSDSKFVSHESNQIVNKAVFKMGMESNVVNFVQDISKEVTNSESEIHNDKNVLANSLQLPSGAVNNFDATVMKYCSEYNFSISFSKLAKIRRKIIKKYRNERSNEYNKYLPLYNHFMNVEPDTACYPLIISKLVPNYNEECNKNKDENNSVKKQNGGKSGKIINSKIKAKSDKNVTLVLNEDTTLIKLYQDTKVENSLLNNRIRTEEHDHKTNISDTSKYSSTENEYSPLIQNLSFQNQLKANPLLHGGNTINVGQEREQHNSSNRKNNLLGGKEVSSERSQPQTIYSHGILRNNEANQCIQNYWNGKDTNAKLHYHDKNELSEKKPTLNNYDCSRNQVHFQKQESEYFDFNYDNPDRTDLHRESPVFINDRQLGKTIEPLTNDFPTNYEYSIDKNNTDIDAFFTVSIKCKPETCIERDDINISSLRNMSSTDERLQSSNNNLTFRLGGKESSKNAILAISNVEKVVICGPECNNMNTQDIRESKFSVTHGNHSSELNQVITDLDDDRQVSPESDYMDRFSSDLSYSNDPRLRTNNASDFERYSSKTSVSPRHSAPERYSSRTSEHSRHSASERYSSKTSVSPRYSAPEERSTTEPSRYSAPEERSATEPSRYSAPEERSTTEPSRYSAPEERSTTEPSWYSAPEERSTTEPSRYSAPEERSTTEPSRYSAPEERSTTEPSRYSAPEERSTTEPSWYSAPEERSTTEPSRYSAPEERSTTEPLRYSAAEERSTTEQVETPLHIEFHDDVNKKRFICYENNSSRTSEPSHSAPERYSSETFEPSHSAPEKHSTRTSEPSHAASERYSSRTSEHSHSASERYSSRTYEPSHSAPERYSSRTSEPSHSAPERYSSRSSEPSHSASERYSSRTSEPSHSAPERYSSRTSEPSHSAPERYSSRTSEPSHSASERYSSRTYEPSHSAPERYSSRTSEPSHSAPERYSSRTSEPSHSASERYSSKTTESSQHIASERYSSKTSEPSHSDPKQHSSITSESPQHSASERYSSKTSVFPPHSASERYSSRTSEPSHSASERYSSRTFEPSHSAPERYSSRTSEPSHSAPERYSSRTSEPSHSASERYSSKTTESSQHIASERYSSKTSEPSHSDPKQHSSITSESPQHSASERYSSKTSVFPPHSASERYSSRTSEPSHSASERYSSRTFEPSHSAPERYSSRTSEPSHSAPEQYSSRTSEPSHSASERYSSRTSEPSHSASERYSSKTTESSQHIASERYSSKTSEPSHSDPKQHSSITSESPQHSASERYSSKTSVFPPHSASERYFSKTSVFPPHSASERYSSKTSVFPPHSASERYSSKTSVFPPHSASERYSSKTSVFPPHFASERHSSKTSEPPRYSASEQYSSKTLEFPPLSASERYSSKTSVIPPHSASERYSSKTSVSPRHSAAEERSTQEQVETPLHIEFHDDVSKKRFICYEIVGDKLVKSHFLQSVKSVDGSIEEEKPSQMTSTTNLRTFSNSDNNNIKSTLQQTSGYSRSHLSSISSGNSLKARNSSFGNSSKSSGYYSPNSLKSTGNYEEFGNHLHNQNVVYCSERCRCQGHHFKKSNIQELIEKTILNNKLNRHSHLSGRSSINYTLTHNHQNPILRESSTRKPSKTDELHNKQIQMKKTMDDQNERGHTLIVNHHSVNIRKSSTSRHSGNDIEKNQTANITQSQPNKKKKTVIWKCKCKQKSFRTVKDGASSQKKKTPVNNKESDSTFTSNYNNIKSPQYKYMCRKKVNFPKKTYRNTFKRIEEKITNRDTKVKDNKVRIIPHGGKYNTESTTVCMLMLPLEKETQIKKVKFMNQPQEHLISPKLKTDNQRHNCIHKVKVNKFSPNTCPIHPTYSLANSEPLLPYCKMHNTSQCNKKYHKMYHAQIKEPIYRTKKYKIVEKPLKQLYLSNLRNNEFKNRLNKKKISNESLIKFYSSETSPYKFQSISEKGTCKLNARLIRKEIPMIFERKLKTSFHEDITNDKQANDLSFNKWKKDLQISNNINNNANSTERESANPTRNVMGNSLLDLNHPSVKEKHYVSLDAMHEKEQKCFLQDGTMYPSRFDKKYIHVLPHLTTHNLKNGHSHSVVNEIRVNKTFHETINKNNNRYKQKKIVTDTHTKRNSTQHNIGETPTKINATQFSEASMLPKCDENINFDGLSKENRLLENVNKIVKDGYVQTEYEIDNKYLENSLETKYYSNFCHLEKNNQLTPNLNRSAKYRSETKEKYVQTILDENYTTNSKKISELNPEPNKKGKLQNTEQIQVETKRQTIKFSGELIFEGQTPKKAIDFTSLTPYIVQETISSFIKNEENMKNLDYSEETTANKSNMVNKHLKFSKKNLNDYNSYELTLKLPKIYKETKNRSETGFENSISNKKEDVLMVNSLDECANTSNCNDSEFCESSSRGSDDSYSHIEISDCNTYIKSTLGVNVTPRDSEEDTSDTDSSRLSYCWPSENPRKVKEKCFRSKGLEKRSRNRDKINDYKVEKLIASSSSELEDLSKIIFDENSSTSLSSYKLITTKTNNLTVNNTWFEEQNRDSDGKSEYTWTTDYLTSDQE